MLIINILTPYRVHDIDTDNMNKKHGLSIVPWLAQRMALTITFALSNISKLNHFNLIRWLENVEHSRI